MVSLEITATTGGEINSLARPVLAERTNQGSQSNVPPLLSSLLSARYSRTATIPYHLLIAHNGRVSRLRWRVRPPESSHETFVRC